MRNKETIAILKGFLRREVKGDPDSGDTIFAKGVLAGIEWLTQKDRPCPYAELMDDFDDNGGWEEVVATKAAATGIGVFPGVATSNHSTQQVASVPAPSSSPIIDPNDPYANLPKPQIIIPDEYKELMELTPEEIAAASGSASVSSTVNPDNKRFLAPDPSGIEAAASKHGWVRKLKEDLQDVITEGDGSVPITNRNAVIVGAGLEDEPVFSRGWD